MIPMKDPERQQTRVPLAWRTYPWKERMANDTCIKYEFKSLQKMDFKHKLKYLCSQSGNLCNPEPLGVFFV
ncbi:hypothetical protein JOE21_000056 [Desmospora profundinema]|uniref:Uncharacterized protein n=1 Tax=Desmospora profundinema TaxID=1571184 RepID=A0ABU1IH17_9BACL|nr:hypothetical protein [Desmospora profundinema]